MRIVQEMINEDAGGIDTSAQFNSTTSEEPETSGETNAQSMWPPINLGSNYCGLRNCQKQLYFEEFFNNSIENIQPFRSYREGVGYYYASRDIIVEIASREPILLAAIVAVGAQITWLKFHLEEDRLEYKRHSSECLKGLETCLRRFERNRFQGVIVTLLLLASNVKVSPHNGQSHIESVEKLLQSISCESEAEESTWLKLVVFCKHWLKSLNIKQCLQKLESKENIPLVTNWKVSTSREVAILKSIGIIRGNGFDLMNGVHIDVEKALKELIFCCRAEYSSDTFRMMDCAGLLNRELSTEFYASKAIVKHLSLIPVDLSEGTLVNIAEIQGRRYLISWMDLSHKINVLALVVCLFRHGFQLSKSNSHVQNANRRIVNFVRSLIGATDIWNCDCSSLCLLQWPVLIAGFNCVKETDLLVLILFFQKAIWIDKFNTSEALRKLKLIWKQGSNQRRDSRSVYSTESSQTATSSTSEFS